MLMLEKYQEFPNLLSWKLVPPFFSSNGYQLKGKRVITLPQQSLMMLVITVDRSELPKSPVEVGSFYLPFYKV